MKEATGELNMTVVTVVAIAAIGVLVYTFVWPALESSIQQSTICAGGNGTVVNGTGATCSADGAGQMTCSHPDVNSNTDFTCDNVAN